MDKKEAKELLKKLEKYYGEPVKPVSDYCNAFYTWAEQIMLLHKHGVDSDVHGYEYVHVLPIIIRDIEKSDLLARLIYDNQKLRTTQCPVHKGQWSGLHSDPCEYDCDYTGWIYDKNEQQEDDNNS